MTEYLTAVEVLAMHEDQIKRFGGSPGLRDPGALESALYRPQTGYYNDLIEEAAALWESLSQNHPFVDGNKRTAFAATFTFLMVNGYEFVEGAAANACVFVISLYDANSFNFQQLVPWLRDHVRSIDNL